MQDVLHILQHEFHAWNGLDWVVAGILAFSTCAAFIRGFIRSAVSLLAIAFAVVTAMFYAPRSAPVLLGWFGSPMLARVASFTLVLLAVYVTVSLLGRLLRGMFHAAGLGFLDRVAGAAFGMLRGVLLLAAFAIPAGPYLAHSIEGHDSVLLPYLLRASLAVSSVMPHDFDRHRSVHHWTDWMLSSDAPAQSKQPARLR